MAITTVHSRKFEKTNTLTLRAEVKTFGYLQRDSCLFGNFHHVDIWSTAQKNHTGSTAFEAIEKKNAQDRNKENPSSTCGQQCVVNRQEHNRSWEGNVARKKKNKISRQWHKKRSAKKYSGYGFQKFPKQKTCNCKHFLSNGTARTQRAPLACNKTPRKFQNSRLPSPAFEKLLRAQTKKLADGPVASMGWPRRPSPQTKHHSRSTDSVPISRGLRLNGAHWQAV